MIALEHTVVIKRPIEEVFDFINDPANDAKWQPSTVHSEQASIGSYGVGTTVRQVNRFMGLRMAASYEITHFEPPTGSSFEGAAGPLSFAGRSQLERTDAGTRLTATGEIGAPWPVRLALPIIGVFARRDLEASLARLKELLEQP